jgi:hypothetical protein
LRWERSEGCDDIRSLAVSDAEGSMTNRTSARRLSADFTAIVGQLSGCAG